jgi:carboxymethylenebutenolidase
MAVYGALPDGSGPHPGVVVIQHAPGVDTFMQAMVQRLADAGYAAVAPDLYHRQAPAGFAGLERMGRLKDAEVEADVNAAVDYLAHETGIDDARLAVIGFCMGGRVAYLVAAANPRFKAAVVYYGGNIRQAWGEGTTTPFARTAQIHCPVLAHFGADDTNPSPQDMQALDAELTRHGKPHVFHAYPHAGHAFMNFTNAERYRQAASEASWPRTLDFLADHLRRA